MLSLNLNNIKEFTERSELDNEFQPRKPRPSYCSGVGTAIIIIQRSSAMSILIWVCPRHRHFIWRSIRTYDLFQNGWQAVSHITDQFCVYVNLSVFYGNLL